MRSILEPEAELMEFLPMRVTKPRTTAKKVPKMQFEFLIWCMHMFFGTGNPNLRSIFKPEVELMVFLRMRSYKITRKGEKFH